MSTLSYNPLLDDNIKPVISHKEKISILFNLFIKKGIEFGPQEFKRELVAANRLIKKYPEFDFFFSLTDMTNVFNSLLGLTSKNNSFNLDKRYEEFIVLNERMSRL